MNQRRRPENSLKTPQLRQEKGPPSTAEPPRLVGKDHKSHHLCSTVSLAELRAVGDQPWTSAQQGERGGETLRKKRLFSEPKVSCTTHSSLKHPDHLQEIRTARDLVESVLGSSGCHQSSEGLWLILGFLSYNFLPSTQNRESFCIGTYKQQLNYSSGTGQPLCLGLSQGLGLTRQVLYHRVTSQRLS